MSSARPASERVRCSPAAGSRCMLPRSVQTQRQSGHQSTIASSEPSPMPARILMFMRAIGASPPTGVARCERPYRASQSLYPTVHHLYLGCVDRLTSVPRRRTAHPRDVRHMWFQARPRWPTMNTRPASRWSALDDLGSAVRRWNRFVASIRALLGPRRDDLSPCGSHALRCAGTPWSCRRRRLPSR